ncbi:MAG: alpha-galactosidase, partial [Flavitalea sp.]
KPATENEGKVLMGTLAWSGNFKFDFEKDAYDHLRLITGINPFASDYTLASATIFRTPSFIYTLSNNGKGEASRNLHSWARNYRLKDGNGSRLTLLNNWEATYFDFDENKLVGLFKGAKDLGVNLFLLDDGWFANKYPRNDDHAGLGDWQENVKKLPNGIGYLVKEAKAAGIGFGIWVEPEMVNPKSELYEKHRDWVLRQPGRPETYFRNQLVLDLVNPEVQNFVFGILDTMLTKNPDMAYIKWDCNAVIYNAHSMYLAKQKLPQSHVYVEYVRGLYKVLDRLRKKYPSIPMMLCSGGGGRVDYEALKYFTEYWPSDNTDPLERIFIQWENSYFFPSIASCNHVTNSGNQPFKYKIDVAMMGKLGFDIVVDHLTPSDLVFGKQALKVYDSISGLVWHGDLYRLADPKENNMASLLYANPEKTRAVMFNYLTNYRTLLSARIDPVRLNGLDAAKKYTVREINTYPGQEVNAQPAKTYSGDYLMNVGINPDISYKRSSVVLLIEEQK